jgi:hypothetical protein
MRTLLRCPPAWARTATRAAAGWPVVALAWLAAGCAVPYRVETTLNPDGSVTRSIDQPADALPDAAAKLPWDGTLRYETRTPAGGQSRRFAVATGRFATPADIPDHLVRPTGGELIGKPDAVSRLARPATRPAESDYVFVITRQWRETLTDVVTPEGLRASRDELIGLAADLLDAYVREVAVGRYDASDLVRWVRTEGRAWVTQVTDAAALHASAARHRERFGEPSGSAWQALAASTLRASAARGLGLGDGTGNWAEQAEVNRRVADFAVALLRKTVRTRGGQPIDEATARRWVAASPLRSGRKDDPPDPDAEAFLAKAEAAFKRVLDARGGETAIKARAAALVAQVVGAYAGGQLETHQFEFVLNVPGGLVTLTDGTLVDDDRVRWRFDGHQAWPAGYDMTCRYCVPAVDVQRKLLGGTPLVTRKAVGRYLELLAQDAEAVTGERKDVGPFVAAATRPTDRTLSGVLDECRTAGTIDPLRAHAAALDKLGGPGALALARCRQMMELLGVRP